MEGRFSESVPPFLLGMGSRNTPGHPKTWYLSIRGFSTSTIEAEAIDVTRIKSPLTVLNNAVHKVTSHEVSLLLVRHTL